MEIQVSFEGKILKFSVPPNATSKKVLERWCTAHGGSASHAENLKLHYEGTSIASNVRISDLVDESDVLTIEGPPLPVNEKKESSEMIVEKKAAEHKKIKLHIATGEDHNQGLRASMEDASLICNSLGVEKSSCLTCDENNKVHFVAVYDGHGGHECSRWLSENLHTVVAKFLINEVSVESALEKAFEEADRMLIDEHPEILAGSTCISVLIEEATNTMWVANVGDSRCVLGSKSGAFPMSDDHKPTKESEEARIRSAGGWVTFGRVMGFLAVSRAFGDAEMKADSCQMIIAKPEIKKHVITEEDGFLVLACDGLWDVLSNEEVVKSIYEGFGKGKNCTEVSSELVKRSIDELRSMDNVSVITLKFHNN